MITTTPVSASGGRTSNNPPCPASESRSTTLEHDRGPDLAGTGPHRFGVDGTHGLGCECASHGGGDHLRG